MHRRSLVCLVPLLLFALGCANSASPPKTPPAPLVTLTGKTMGTTYAVKLAGLSPNADHDAIQAEIDRILERVNDQMSTYRPESELSRFNSYDGTDWFDVSADTAAVVREALRVSRLCDGAFDVTVGPLVNLWHFGPGQRTDDVPSDDEIAAARERVGYMNVEVRNKPPALRKSRGDVSLDLSAIAKGFGVDRVALFCESLHPAGYLVEIGGEMRAKGHKADGSPWVIGIESPVENERALQKAVEIGERSLATSGDYRNFFQQGGRRYSHTVDPRTGRPVTHQLASASVFADNCMFADAVATTLMVLGPEEGYTFAVKHELAALLIIRNEEGFVEKATPRFEELFAPNTADSK